MPRLKLLRDLFGSGVQGVVEYLQDTFSPTTNSAMTRIYDPTSIVGCASSALDSAVYSGMSESVKDHQWVEQNNTRSKSYINRNSKVSVSTRQTATLSAMKHPNQNVGVILTRHSKTKPNVTVISRVMNDSIFAQYKGLVGMQVTAVNGIPIQNARQAAELIILANREVSLTVKHVQENELTQASLKCDRIGMMQSVDSEETNSSTPSEQGMEVVYNDIIEMASSRLKASLRDRMRHNLSHSGSISVDGSLDSSIKRKISSFDRHFKHQTDVIDIALMPSYGSESTSVLSVDSPRNVTKKHDDDASASSISFYLGISRSDAWDDMTETDAKTFPLAPPSSDDLAAQKHGCLDSGILANGSSVTASTVDLTEILSSIEASCSLCSSGEESSNTRYILSVDTMQTDDVDVADTLGDLSTPALIMMASKFEQKVLTPRKFEQKVLTPDAFVSPTTKVNNVFSRMMFKVSACFVCITFVNVLSSNFVTYTVRSHVK